MGGQVLAWGYNGAGQTTVPAAAQSGVSAIAAGGSHTLALKGGAVLAWGNLDTVPTEAQSGVSAITAGGEHSLALKNGGVIAWGSNNFGQTTVPPEALSGVVAIRAGSLHSVALTSAGKVLVWGDNSQGQGAVPAAAQSGVTAIGAGSYHTLAVIGTPSVDFGNKILGAASTAKTFTLRNTGTGPLAITSVSTLGGNSSDFTVNTSLMSPPIFAGGEGVVIVTFNPTATGPRTTTLRILSDDADEAITNITLTGRLLTALENWRQIYFGNIANSGAGADLNDYKQDGTVNLLKFAFGLNPVLNTPGQLPRPQRTDTNFVATFTQPSGVSGILYGAEWSLTLAPGSWTDIPDTGLS